MSQRPSWQEAWDMAIELFGYPCPCEKCSEDGGLAKSQEISEFVRDLTGMDNPPDRWTPHQDNSCV